MFRYRIVRHAPGGYRLERRDLLGYWPTWEIDCYAATRSRLRNYLREMRQALAA